MSSVESPKKTRWSRSFCWPECYTKQSWDCTTSGRSRRRAVNWQSFNDMSEHEPVRHHPNIPENRRNPEQDGSILLPDTLKERMPSLYSQEPDPDPLVVCKFLTF